MAKEIKRSIGARLNEKGLEVLSNIKKAVHVKIRRPVSEHQRFRQYLDAQSKAAALAGEDSYEEFMDFGPEDPRDLPDSPYELVFDPRTGKEMLPAEKIWLDRQFAEFQSLEAEKRKAQKREQSATSDYVTEQAPKVKKQSKKQAPSIPEDDRE